MKIHPLIKPPGTGKVEWTPAGGDIPVQTELAMDKLGVASDLAVGAELTADKLAVDLNALAVVSGLVVPQLDVKMNALTVATAVAVPKFQTTAILAAKDVWFPNVAGCADDANKNGTNLSIDPTVATRKDALVSFDLSMFPAGSAVTNITLTMNVVTAPAVNAALVMSNIANADEGWSESAVKCSAHPAAGGLLGSETIANGFTGEISFAYNGAGNAMVSRFDARMGTTSCSIYLAGSVAGAYDLQSKDSGGSPGNAFGFRAALTFTIP